VEGRTVNHHVQGSGDGLAPLCEGRAIYIHLGLMVRLVASMRQVISLEYPRPY
jgi:hypothetical protein